MNKPGMLIVLSGPSGSGKGTILKKLLERRPRTVVSISATTRSPRPGEKDGVQYFFRTREEFEGMIARGELLEYAEYNGNYYGTPAPAIDRWLAEGIDVVLEIEVQGAEKVMQKRQDLVSIFIGIPSLEELEHRLRGRGTEEETAICGRMAAAVNELACANRYQYLVMNDEVELAVQRIEAILTAEKLRFTRMENQFMEVMKHA
ncbi:MAG: guanylate kinase [Clostridia bacterium]|nr:guanylate kinase [Clostridia bacterium]